MPNFTNAHIKHMVSRFLGWRLPENFSPDCGISFKADFNEDTTHPMKHTPIGTNLFDAVQAEAMVRYLIAGMPDDPATVAVTPSEEQRRNAVDFAVRSLSGSDDIGDIRTTTMMTRAKRLALFLAGNLDA